MVSPGRAKAAIVPVPEPDHGHAEHGAPAIELGHDERDGAAAVIVGDRLLRRLGSRLCRPWSVVPWRSSV